MLYVKTLTAASVALALILLSSCGTIAPIESPVLNPVRDQLPELQATICRPAGDLLRPVEPEPLVPTPRDPEQGLQPDELLVYTQTLAEWGSRGWYRTRDWIDRENTLGSCTRRVEMLSE